MHDLHRSLVDRDMAMLRALADSRGVALETNIQIEAADRLAEALRDPVSVRTAVARLSPRARDALGALLAAGGRQRAPRFARQFGEIRHIGPGRLAREAPWRAPANPAEELWYAGLIFCAFAEDESGAAEFVYVPEDVQPLLPEAETEGAAFSVAIVPDVPTPARMQPTLVEDLFHYLVQVQNRDVRSDADGDLAQNDRALLRARVPWAGERRLAFMRHLAARLGFVVHDSKEGTLRLEAAPAKQWLTASPAEQLATVQRAWRDDPTWNDLCHVPGIDCDTETAWHQRYDPVVVRQAILGFLARCPNEAWWSLESFLRAVKETDPDFQRPDGDYTGWYVRDEDSGEYLSGFESWDRVEGALIADLCTEVLRALGILSVIPNLSPDSAETGREVACRLTAAGLAFLGERVDVEKMADVKPLQAAEESSLLSPPVIVRPDFSIEVPLPASLYTRFQLERFADPHGSAPRPAGAPKRGMAYRYHLSAASLGRGLARGIRVDQVLAFLRQVGANQVPANVAGQIEAWAERHGQVTLQEVVLLRVRSERAMRELMALPETRALIDRPLSPTTALVRQEHLLSLKRVLRELGYLPPQD
ncbi:MAG: helicase-associated domain-containing protein [Anaerolineae bacterium]|nr:helicase-associated domain-containing protein [Anaerolineae bacterium]